ncbi:phage baseplate assembly protein V [Meiothermus sp. Pnk-1]|uniref:phage baseplate assembly protein V n=1 Tax=Meiothermus sp. Pnk-1 TaxID=873128 RepID=UPI000D7D086F|nr:phage baseplate assembly protein V [Meiothermus sp. Pnk-1]PZA08295.1 hypothetical protein DNA98_03940 [Meiothermus sp. Pnk-1]
MLKGIHLAQVIAIHPGTAQDSPTDTAPYAATLSVLLSNLMMMGGTDEAPRFRVRMLTPGAGPSAGRYSLPRVGDWGLVAFTENDGESGFWLGSIPDDLRHAAPEELWRKDPYAEVWQHISDFYQITHGDGTQETVWPDGTLLKVTTRKDGAPGNPSLRAAKTPRKVRRKKAGGSGFESQRVDYPFQAEPPVDIVLKHSSGAEVRISADGSFFLSSPRGHTLRLFDDDEKGRDRDGHITTPGNAGADSAIVLEAAGGARIKLQENPVKIVIEAAQVELGEGASQGVARLGDTVEVTVPPGTFWVNQNVPNPVPVVLSGTIKSGSSKVKAK